MTIDCVSLYFPHKIIEKTESRPTYDTLKKLQNMIKANASSVISDLGGGAHGHLGLVLPSSEYNNIINTTYIKPEHPGELKIYDNIFHYMKQSSFANFITKNFIYFAKL